MSALQSGSIAPANAAESPEHPGYFVTPSGHVWSRRVGRYLKPIRMGQYSGLQLRGRDGRLHKRYVHRLVLEVLVGPCPPGMEARHLDGDKANNAVDNLAWGTPRENSADKRRHGTIGAGERNSMARLTTEQAAQIRAAVAAGATQRSQCAIHGVSAMTVSRLVRNLSWVV